MAAAETPGGAWPNSARQNSAGPGPASGHVRALGLPRRQAAFTLVEVLAALAFMAIVIPVAVEGLRVANLAGQVSQRKLVAARVAERVLNEWLITGQSQSPAQSGVAREGTQDYRWTIRMQPWSQDTMRLVTVEVLYTVQGRDYDVHLSTLLDNSTT